MNFEMKLANHRMSTRWAILKLRQDLKRIAHLSSPDYRVISHTNIFKWTVIVKGPCETPLENQWFIVFLMFPAKYPTQAPVISMECDVFHPNLDPGTKRFWTERVHCAGWKSTFDAHSVLVSLRETLVWPWPKIIVNRQAALVFADRPRYVALVKHKIWEHREKRGVIHLHQWKL